MNKSMKRFKLLLSVFFVGILYISKAQDAVSIKDAVVFALENKADAKRADLAIKKLNIKLTKQRQALYHKLVQMQDYNIILLSKKWH